MTTADRHSRRTNRFASPLLKVGLASFSVLLVVLCFELGLRIMGFQAIYEIYSKGSTLWQADPILGWHHIPNSSDVFVGPRPWPIEFETPVRFNSLGLRGPEVPARSEDDIRLLFLGDSMVIGMEVEYEKTFVARTAEELSKRTGKKIRAINAGVRGYGTDQSLLYFREHGRLLEADVVVFFHSGNDPRNNLTLHRMRRAMGKSVFVFDEDRGLEQVGSPVPDYPMCSAYSIGSKSEIKRLDGLFSRIMCVAQMFLFDRSALFSFITLRVDWNPAILHKLYYLAVPKVVTPMTTDPGDDPPRQITLALLDALNKDVQQEDAHLVLIGEDWQLKELGLDGLQSREIDVSPLWQPSDEERLLNRFIRDAHYTERGHQRVVDQLVPKLEAVLLETGRLGDGR